MKYVPAVPCHAMPISACTHLFTSSNQVVLSYLDSVTNVDTSRSFSRKLAPPLVTLLNSEPETQYVALRNINLIVQKRPGILESEIKVGRSVGCGARAGGEEGRGEETGGKIHLVVRSYMRRHENYVQVHTYVCGVCGPGSGCGWV